MQQPADLSSPSKKHKLDTESTANASTVLKSSSSNKKHKPSDQNNIPQKNPTKASDFTCPKPVYIIQGGLRKVLPYHYDLVANAKARWIGKPLLQVFSQEFIEKPNSYYQKAIQLGLLTVSGRRVRPEHVIRNGDLIVHRIHRHEAPVLADPIGIVYEDEEVLVVNKPGGMPVHPTGRFRFNSLIEIVRAEGHQGINSQEQTDRLSSESKVDRKTLQTEQTDCTSSKQPIVQRPFQTEQTDCTSSESNVRHQTSIAEQSFHLANTLLQSLPKANSCQQFIETTAASSAASSLDPPIPWAIKYEFLATVNRLDRVTSGIVILAKTSQAAAKWTKLLRREQVTDKESPDSLLNSLSSNGSTNELSSTAGQSEDSINDNKFIRKIYLALVKGCFPNGSTVPNITPKCTKHHNSIAVLNTAHNDFTDSGFHFILNFNFIHRRQCLILNAYFIF